MENRIIYKTGCIFIKEGFYSEAEIKEILDKFLSRDRALSASMKKVGN